MPGGTAPRWGAAGTARSDPCPTPPGPTDDGCVVQGRLSRIDVEPGDDDGHRGAAPAGQLVPAVPEPLDRRPGVRHRRHALRERRRRRELQLRRLGPGRQPGEPVRRSAGRRAARRRPPPRAARCAARTSSRAGDPPSLRRRDAAHRRRTTAAGARGARRQSARRERRRRATTSSSPTASATRSGIDAAARHAARSGSPRSAGTTGRRSTASRNPSDSVVENFGWPCYEGGERREPAAGRLRRREPDAVREPLHEPVSNLGGGATSVVTAPHYAYHHDAAGRAGRALRHRQLVRHRRRVLPRRRLPGRLREARSSSPTPRASCVWTMFADAGGDAGPAQRARRSSRSAAGRVVDVQIGPGGDVFYVDFDGGNIFRVEYFPPTRPPTAAIHATPSERRRTARSCSSTARASSDPEDGANLGYAWDLDGDGAFDDSTRVAPTLDLRGGRQPYGARCASPTPGGASDVASVVDHRRQHAAARRDPGAGAGPDLGGRRSDRLLGRARSIRRTACCRRHSLSLVDPDPPLRHARRLPHASGAGRCRGWPRRRSPRPTTSTRRTSSCASPRPTSASATGGTRPGRAASGSPSTTARQAQNLDGFPVLVSLDPTRIDYGRSRTSGADLRFVDADGDTAAALRDRAAGTRPASRRSGCACRASTRGSDADHVWHVLRQRRRARRAERGRHLGRLRRRLAPRREPRRLDREREHAASTTAPASSPGRFGERARASTARSWIDAGNGRACASPARSRSRPGSPSTTRTRAARRACSRRSRAWDAAQGYNLEYQPGENNLTTVGSGRRLRARRRRRSRHGLALGRRERERHDRAHVRRRRSTARPTPRSPRSAAGSQTLRIGREAAEFFWRRIDEIRIAPRRALGRLDGARSTSR